MKYHNTEIDDAISKGTLKNYFTTEKYIKEFLIKRYKTSDLSLAEISYQFITEFDLFLRHRKPTNGQKKQENNGVMKHLERLRKVANLAVKLEWITRNLFERFQLKFLRTDRGYLTKEELAITEKAAFKLNRLEWLSDLFVFNCYTGLSYIDVMQLIPEHVCLGIDGEFWIKTARQKTNTIVTVPLLPQAKFIIEKYKSDLRSISTGTAFPVISNQKMNKYLKEVAKASNINKNFSFHLARHTFATTVTLSNGVPIETVSKMLRHTKITTTQIYAKVIERKIGPDMRLLQNKLSSKK